MHATTPTAHLLSRLALLFALAAIAACGDDPPAAPPAEPEPAPEQEPAPEPEPEPEPVPEPEPEAQPEAPPLTLTDPQEGVSPDGADVDAFEPAAGQVRVGVVRSETGGFGGEQAACRPGCFALINARARFCIEGRETGSHLFFDGGRIIDAEPVGVEPYRDTGGRDRLDIGTTFIDSKSGSAEAVEVIRDGAAGPLAVLRVTGREEPSSYLAGIVGPAFFKRRDVEVITEYRLAADSNALEIVTFIKNRSDSRETIIPGDIIFWGDTMGYIFPGQGERTPRQTQEVVAFGRGVAYGWFNETPAFPAGLIGLTLPALPLSQAGQPVQSGAQIATRRWLAVGAHVADVLSGFYALRPEHPTAFEGVRANLTLTRGGQPLQDAQVQLTALGDDNMVVGDTLWIDHSDAEGRVPLFAPAGRYRIVIFDPIGGQRLRDADLTEGAEIAVELPEIAKISFNINTLSDGERTPSPAKVRLVGGQAGERRLVFVLRGQQTVEVLPGGWTWEISRGLEYTIASGQLTVGPGEQVDVAADLEHVLITPGFVSGEFHQHQTASLDSEVAVKDRVLSNIAEGVDFAVSSDHDVATDFAPVIAEMGAEDLIASLSGTEVSPSFGHFGAYPADYDPDAPGNGALPLAYKDEEGAVRAYANGAELIEAMRSITGARLIQSNHPRDSTGYFDDGGWVAGQHPETADEGFSLDFDTMEVVNGPLCEQLQDFYALLNVGKSIIGVGNSDSHGLNKAVGYPRNFIPSAAGGPEGLTEDGIIDGVLTGDVVISAAAYLEFGPGQPDDPEAVRPGRLVAASRVTVDVRAMTPPWAEVTRLFVIRNGLVVDELTIGGGPEAIVDFDGPVDLDAGDQDAWFQIVAFSPERLQVVYPGERIYAMSNAFFLDADGNGQFDPPGVIELDPETIAFCQ